MELVLTFFWSVTVSSEGIPKTFFILLYFMLRLQLLSTMINLFYLYNGTVLYVTKLGH